MNGDGSRGHVVTPAAVVLPLDGWNRKLRFQL